MKMEPFMPEICLFALNSSYSHTNLAVRCIRERLTSAGFAAGVLEFSLKDRHRRVLKALVDADAEIYGFSAYIWNIRELYSLAADLKRLLPAAQIVFGGPEVSFDAAEILAAHPFIDGIVTGEGEEAWVRIAGARASGEVLPPVIDGGEYADFAAQPMVYEEADAGCRMVYYESARGCPYRCAYCLSAMSGKVRAKSAEKTLFDLLDFERMSGIRVVKFVDRTFNFDGERARAIWRGLLSERYTKTYHFEICGDLLAEEDFALLSQFPAGKIQLEIGVQSTNPDTLRRVRRNPDTARLLENIARLYAMGNMHIHADLIAGLPGEDFAAFARSFDMLWGACHMLQLGFLKLLRGSVLRREADAFGCVYSTEPPYEVLATDCLSFAELSRLHEVDELLDRCVNSGVMARSFCLLTARHASPFAMLLRLADGMRAAELRVDAMAQGRLYPAVYDILHDGEDAPLAEALMLDFLTHQTVSPPVIGGMALRRVEHEAKRRFMTFADAAGIAHFAPALEVREGFGQRYVIDRRSMRAFRETADGFDEV